MLKKKLMKLVIAWRLSLNPPHKQVNKSTSLSIVPLFILSQSPEWREARERRENDGKYPCAPPVLPPSLVQYVPNEHVTSRTHFILFNWSSHPSWGDPICGAFNLRGPLIITVAHTHSPRTYSSHQRTENVKVDRFSAWIWNSKWWDAAKNVMHFRAFRFNSNCKHQSLTGQSKRSNKWQVKTCSWSTTFLVSGSKKAQLH